MKRRAVKLGVPAERVLVETAALTTRENATGCAAIMRAHGLARALVVTQPFHRARAVAAFRRAGVDGRGARVRRDAPSRWQTRAARAGGAGWSIARAAGSERARDRRRRRRRAVREEAEDGHAAVARRSPRGWSARRGRRWRRRGRARRRRRRGRARARPRAVSSVWLTVPSEARATMRSGRPRRAARSAMSSAGRDRHEQAAGAFDEREVGVSSVRRA